MQNILIVGGAGYIGSHVVKMLDQAGYYPIILDNLSTGSVQAVTRGLFIQGDIADNLVLDRVFQTYSISAVMHFAALTDVGESIVNPQKYYFNNVANTMNLLHAMMKYQVKMFVFSSTAAIFGLPLQDYISENHPCKPINPYGKSKLIVEQILQDFDHAYGLRFCCLRYFNAAGGDPDKEIKNYKKKESNLIPVILRSLKSGDSTVTIFGTDYPTPDGTCLRDYIHVYDLGVAHLKALEKLFKEKQSCCFNLGNGRGFSVREVIHVAEQITNNKLRIIEGPRREGDPPVLLANGMHARQALDWFPQYADLSTMVNHAWQALV